MSTDEFRFKRGSYDCTRLDVCREVEVSELEVSSLFSANNRVT